MKRVTEKPADPTRIEAIWIEDRYEPCEEQDAEMYLLTDDGLAPVRRKPGQHPVVVGYEVKEEGDT